ncbi:MAG: hypothetical protein F6J93_14065 [Oscillatoria sp. SIO1A7]|nr:hypothetical protein [Oscillatoria sp. SIO1A7]
MPAPCLRSLQTNRGNRGGIAPTSFFTNDLDGSSQDRLPRSLGTQTGNARPTGK